MIVGPDAPLAGTDVVVIPADVATSFAPADHAELPVMVAWVHGRPTSWLRLHGLEWFDVLLCGSAGLESALAPLFSGPIEVFQHAVDTALFTPPDDRVDDRIGFVSTVEQHPDDRPLVAAIGSTPFTTPTAILDAPTTYPRSLRRFARGRVAPLARGCVLRRAATAFSAPARGEIGPGVLERAALEALCCGTAVVSPSDLGRVGLPSAQRVADGDLGRVVDGPPTDASAIAHDREHVRRAHSQRARADRLVEIAAASTSEARPSTVLGFHPNYWTQPYAGNLYRELRSRGVRAVPVAEPRTLLEAPGLQGRSVFHQQWTTPILAGASSAHDATRRADTYLDQLDRLRAEGVPIIWTVHNVLPHECAYPDAEIGLSAGLAQRSDVVHVLNEATVDETAALYQLPASRITVIPEMKDPVRPTMTRSEARARLSLSDDDVVYLAFGRIRPYKQLARLLDAFERHRRSHPRARLLVAGRLEQFAGSRRLARRCRTDAGVMARLGRVPDDDIETLFTASDATIVSYPVLNSGVAVTAIAYGCPVAARAIGGLPEVIGSEGGLLFRDDEDLADVLDRLFTLVTETDVRARVVELARTRSAAAMATAFADVVAGVMHPRGGGGDAIGPD